MLCGRRSRSRRESLTHFRTVLHRWTPSWHGHGTTHGLPFDPHIIPWRGIGFHSPVGGAVACRGGCRGIAWVAPS